MRKVIGLGVLVFFFSLACSTGESETVGSNSPTASPESSPAPTDQTPPAGQDAAVNPEPTPGNQMGGKMESVYTEISVPNCQATVEEDPPIQLLECPGPAGYSLQAHDEDARVSISIVDPQGKVHPLDFWTTVTQAFSSLGPRGEWRLTGGEPTALIVRVNAYEDPDDSDKTTSYLTVAKIRAGEACVVAKVLPSTKQNEQARQIADSSADLGCLS